MPACDVGATRTWTQRRRERRRRREGRWCRCHCGGLQKKRAVTRARRGRSRRGRAWPLGGRVVFRCCEEGTSVGEFDVGEEDVGVLGEVRVVEDVGVEGAEVGGVVAVGDEGDAAETEGDVDVEVVSQVHVEVLPAAEGGVVDVVLVGARGVLIAIDLEERALYLQAVVPFLLLLSDADGGDLALAEDHGAELEARRCCEWQVRRQSEGNPGVVGDADAAVVHRELVRFVAGHVPEVVLLEAREVDRRVGARRLQRHRSPTGATVVVLRYGSHGGSSGHRCLRCHAGHAHVFVVLAVVSVPATEATGAERGFGT
mmetsp:Transcript_2979/g.9006  ORF Transcript_2979/g.9006 Transcript_2979/m.9006 type:complete len:314 (-) Transcript_2979:1196-2137(-)